jgi:hypothetical protein
MSSPWTRASGLPPTGIFERVEFACERADVLPSEFGPLPMLDTRLEALWLLPCLEGHR